MTLCGTSGARRLTASAYRLHTLVSGLNTAQANQKWFPCVTSVSCVPASFPSVAVPEKIHSEPVSRSRYAPSSAVGSNVNVRPVAAHS
jgi:hypothetical protein